MSGKYSVSPRSFASRSTGEPGAHEGGDVGYRIADEVAVALRGDVYGLVEVATAGRVDGDQRQVGRIVVGKFNGRRGVLASARTSDAKSPATANSDRNAAKSSGTPATRCELSARAWRRSSWPRLRFAGALAAVLRAVVFFAAVVLLVAVLRAVVFLAGVAFLAAVLRAVVFFAGVAFLAAVLRAAVFLAVVFAAFFAAALRTAVFLAVVFAAFFAAALRTAVFLAVVFAAFLPQPCEPQSSSRWSSRPSYPQPCEPRSSSRWCSPPSSQRPCGSPSWPVTSWCCLLGSSERILVRWNKWTMHVGQRQRATPTSHKCMVAHKRDQRIIARPIRCTSVVVDSRLDTRTLHASCAATCRRESPYRSADSVEHFERA